MPALDHLLARVAHIVPEIVEAQLVVGAVGDVAGIGGAARLLVELRDDDADAEAEELVDPPHPAGVAAGEVVVHRDDVDALARQRIQIGGERRHQRLALAGLHLGDVAAMEDHAADQLDVEMALPQRALGRLAHGRERVDHEIVELGTLGQALAELHRPRPQRLVGQALDLGLLGVDRLGGPAEALDGPIVGGAEEPLRD